MAPHSTSDGEGDLSSTVAFSLLFVIPAIAAAAVLFAVVAAAWLLNGGD
jgi:hypothetical protein